MVRIHARQPFENQAVTKNLNLPGEPLGDTVEPFRGLKGRDFLVILEPEKASPEMPFKCAAHRGLIQ
jgi:hypothetical protein